MWRQTWVWRQTFRFVVEPDRRMMSSPRSRAVGCGRIFCDVRDRRNCSVFRGLGDSPLSIHRRLPQQHDGVRAPRPPRLGSSIELSHGAVAGHPPQHQIAARKRIRLAKRAHRDVLRGPVADSRNRRQRRRRLPRICRRAEFDRAAQDRSRERSDGLSPRLHDPDRFNVRCHELLGRREQTEQLWRQPFRVA